MYQQAISYEDFQNICRFCLSKGSAENNLNSLYDEKNVSLSKTLSLMVQACLSIQINKNDDLPSQICSICMKRLLNSHNFRKQSLATDYQLRVLLSDFKEQRVLKEIEERIGVDTEAVSSSEIEFIEYVDDAFEIEADQQDDDEQNEHISDTELTEEDFKADLYNEDDEEIELMIESEQDETSELQMQSEQEQSEYDYETNDTNDTNVNVVKRKKPTKNSNERKAVGRKQCKVCGKFVVNLKPHMDTHVEFEQRRKPYQCQYCGKEYLQRAQFDGHVNREHTGLKPFKCDQCDKTFHGRPSLRMHKIQHSNVRRFNCEFCPKSYLYAHHLSHHRYTHTKERLFRCDHCDYTNVHNENLKRHVLSKHTEDEDKPYQCATCSRSFNGKSNLQRHLKYVHHMDRNL